MYKYIYIYMYRTYVFPMNIPCIHYIYIYMQYIWFKPEVFTTTVREAGHGLNHGLHQTARTLPGTLHELHADAARDGRCFRGVGWWCECSTYVWETNNGISLIYRNIMQYHRIYPLVN